MLVQIKFIMSKMWIFLRPFIIILLSQVGPLLAEAAMAAVTVAADINVSDSEKREKAYELIAEDLRSKGVIVTASVINMAIEAAVQKLKESAEKM